MRATLLVLVLARVAHADPELFDERGLHLELAASAEVDPYDPRSRLGGSLRLEQQLGDTPWRLGAATRVTTEWSAAVSAGAAHELPNHWLLRADLGTFTCHVCRGANDPRALLRVELDAGQVAVSAETRVIAYDFANRVRPLGTETQLWLGLGVRDWRGAAIVLGIEALVLGSQALFPSHHGD